MGSPMQVMLPPSEEATPMAQRSLTKRDRCDHRSCDAQAFVRVTLSTGALTFCGHHYAKVEPTVAALPGVEVHDERYRINTQPSQSSGTTL